MLINILNNTSFSLIKVVCGGKELSLKRGESGKAEIADRRIRFDVFICDKNQVLINILFAAIDGILSEDHIINMIKCNASFELYLPYDNSTVVLSELEARKKENDYIYQSVYPSGDSGSVESVSFFKTDTKKQEKKCKFYYGFITSWIFPIAVGLALLLFSGNTVGIVFGVIVSILWLLAFSIPSWKKASRVKKFYSDESANKYLNERIAEINRMGSPDAVAPPDDFIGRQVYKALDKIFGKKSK